MEKLIKSFLIILAMSIGISADAQYRVVTDPQTTATVLSNLATQMAIEQEHNKRLDSIASKQDKIEMYTLSMATIKDIYKLTMENINGFGEESRYYSEIGRCALDIVKDVPELMKTVKNAKWHNQLLCINELTGLVTNTQKLVNDFVKIVCNGKVRNPLKDKATENGENDGYNLLDRYERLTLANRILTDLMEIRYKVMAMSAMAQYGTMNDLFFTIDPEGWANVMVMQNAVSGLIADWNGTVGSVGDKVEFDPSHIDPIFKDIIEWKGY